MTDNHDSSQVWKIAILNTCLLNFSLHLLGFYLLLCLYKGSKRTVQRLCLIHLSLVDALKNILFIPYLCLELKGLQNTTLQQYIDILLMTLIPSLYYSLIILITVDRFLAICLHMKYRVYVTLRRGSFCLYLMWLYSALAGSVLSILYYNGSTDLNFHPYNMYIYLTLDVLFIVTAVGTYIFIFRRYFFVLLV